MVVINIFKKKCIGEKEHVLELFFFALHFSMIKLIRLLIARILNPY